jgi:hypothetical protein
MERSIERGILWRLSRGAEVGETKGRGKSFQSFLDLFICHV